MTTDWQKEQELAHLEKALYLYGIKNYFLIDKSGESPDFLVNIEGEIIGIEVTRIYRDFDNGNSAKAQSDLPFITEEAVTIYNRKGGIPLVFGFGYDGNVAVKCRKGIAEKLGIFLYEYTKDNFPRGIDTIHQIHLNQTSDKSLSFITSVFAQPTSNSTSVGFTASGFGSIQIAISAIETVVRKKEALLSKYLERCDKVRLLIVLPTMTLAGDLRLQGNGDFRLSHKFDAVYVLDEYRSQIHIIN